MGVNIVTLIYAVFFMQWADEGSPFDEVRMPISYYMNDGRVN